jgi:hypothetical protein
MKSVLKRIHRGISERSAISYAAAETRVHQRLSCLFHITPIDVVADSASSTKINKKFPAIIYGRLI